jgi:hypothetical protein
MMKYEHWRNELFDHSPEIDPVTLGHSPEFYAVPPHDAFEFVDRMLVDPEVHSLFDKIQLGNGIQTVYSNCCSDLPFLYTTECTEDRRIEGIRNLSNLYTNYFERYCTGRISSIGNDLSDGPMGYICYMFWDVFVLYPGNGTPRMVSAAVEVMRSVMQSNSDNCLMSAIHGLGHWASDVPEAVSVLKQWLTAPTTANSKVVKYAQAAKSKMIQ